MWLTKHLKSIYDVIFFLRVKALPASSINYFCQLNYKLCSHPHRRTAQTPATLISKYTIRCESHCFRSSSHLPTRPNTLVFHIRAMPFIIRINGKILSLTDSHHNHQRQNTTRVVLCHGGNVHRYHCIRHHRRQQKLVAFEFSIYPGSPIPIGAVHSNSTRVGFCQYLR